MMDPRLTINGVTIHPGASVPTEDLQQAGLSRLGAWHRWRRGLPKGFGYWQAADPQVSCFDGEVDIYACRQSYLDHDRRWGTECLVRQQGEQIVAIEVRIIEGVYAAGNWFDRFIDAGSSILGEPDLRRGGLAAWQRDTLRIEADLAEDARNASFRFLSEDAP